MEIRWVWYRTLITLLFNLTCNANGISNIDTKGNLYEYLLSKVAGRFLFLYILLKITRKFTRKKEGKIYTFLFA
jgi:hypothetical protein